MYSDETIAAAATAYGESGIGIIRVSGARAAEILQKIFVPHADKTHENRSLVYGHVICPEKNEIIDEALAVLMRSPASYTREDVAEIHCHGGAVALKRVLSLVFKSGARPAAPGEFTKRAFLNGRLDLSQAEAVIDLVRAKTSRGFDAALGQLDGVLSEQIRQIRAALMALLVKITVNIEYPDEDIEELTYRELSDSISQIGDEIEKLRRTAVRRSILRDGLSAVIFGSPNVGKSSLLNALLNENRAIVTEIPGTTRDTIEEFVNINGIPVKLTDTAGIRRPENPIEEIGMEKSREALQRADIVLFVLDGSRVLTAEEKAQLASMGARPVIVLLNKSDLTQRATAADVEALLPDAIIVHTAATKSEGIEALCTAIEDMAWGGAIKREESLLVINTRHAHLLEQAAAALFDAHTMTTKGEALDFVEVDLRNSWSLLGEIIGETVSEDIIDKVFADFCLGK